MTAEARAAGRRGDNGTSLNEDFRQTFLNALEVNFLRCRNDDGTYTGSNMTALEDRSCNAHVFDAAVGARTDHRLLNLDVVELVNGLGVLRQMRARNSRAQR